MNRRALYDRLVRQRVPEGSILPRWAVALRWLLFPLDTAYWTITQGRGYQPQRDTWLIEGIEYTGAAMRALTTSSGGVYRIACRDNVVTVERLHALDAEACARICEAQRDPWAPLGYDLGVRDCAAAIRAAGDEPRPR